MKIIYLHQHFATPKMNGITRSYEFARRLVNQGHEVHLITANQDLDSKTTRTYTTVENGIHVYWLPVPYDNRLGFYARVFAFLKYVIMSYRLAIQIGSDIVYASSPPLTIALPGVLAARRLKVPLILEVRDLWPELPICFGALRNPVTIFLARALEDFAYRHSSHIIALSPGMKLGIIERGYPAENITVIPNSCDHELFEGKKVSPTFYDHYPFLKNKQFAIYCGTIGEANGISYIARVAHATLKQGSDFIYVVMGHGKEENQVTQIAESLGVLNNNFFMLPAVSKESMPEILSAATLVLNTLVDKRPLWNSSPNKFFDALAAGRPVAINFEGWLANLLRSTGAGLVLNPKDTVEASSQILTAVSNPAWIESARKSARELGHKQFSREALAELQLATLLKLIGISGKGTRLELRQNEQKYTGKNIK